MIDFFGIYDEKIRSIGDRVAFSDGVDHMTYAELDEASGRIYHYLKNHGIGREVFVQIVLKRGVRIPAAVVGVVKAGAAFMVLEDTYPADRIAYIYDDCDCQLRIDDELYSEIMENTEPLAGHEDPDPHDACYAVYTSGSTGNPKGVLHEYGNIEQGYRSFETWYDEDIDRCAIFAPFYFVAGIIDIFHYITRGRTTYIIPHDMTRDFPTVRQFIRNNGIQEMFLPPTFLKIYREPDAPLKVLYTGSEPANDLSYLDAPTLINFYAMSESGFVVLQANLDKPHEIAPVGRPLLDEIEVRILDDDGHVVEGPGQGELVFKNEYVRGYIHLPEQTESTWRDGWYHTNDLVRRDEEGNYYVIGRFDDMIKINGNRVEPVEIENNIKKLTGLKQVIAKGFHVNNRVFICAYYLEEEASELGLFRDGELVIDTEKLGESLPDYMMPTYYIPLKSFPLLPNGKIARKNLLPPGTAEMKREYIAPTTELEKTICDLFALVLKLDRVGVTDDFYICGGDSMSAIVLAARFSEAGIPIDTKAVFNNRTPGDLAAFYEKNREQLSKKMLTYDNEKALEVPNYSGKAFLKQAKEGQGGIFKYHMTDMVDPKALAQAYENLIENYPFFGFSYEERDGQMYYKEAAIRSGVRPYSKLDRSDHTGKQLIEVYYEDKQIILSFYHVLTDGEGFFFFARTLLHEYINIVQGMDEAMAVRPFDYAYDVMADRLEVSGEYKLYDMPETFKPPEYDTEHITLRTFKISLKRQDWLTIVNAFIHEYDLDGIRRLQGIGGEDAFVAGFLLMKTFGELHPDADKPLLCRFPINMRYALEREDTLRNCAMPQAFYNISAGDVAEDKNAIRLAYERIEEQISLDNIQKEVNRLVEFLTDPDKEIAEDPVYNYLTTADVLATNLGCIASAGDAAYVEDFSINFRPTCCMSIQSCVLGSEQVLLVNQLFENDGYVLSLVRDLSHDGMFAVEMKEVR